MNDDVQALQYFVAKHKYKSFVSWLAVNGYDAKELLAGTQKGGATLLSGKYYIFCNREIVAHNLGDKTEADYGIGTPMAGGGKLGDFLAKSAKVATAGLSTLQKSDFAKTVTHVTSAGLTRLKDSELGKTVTSAATTGMAKAGDVADALKTKGPHDFASVKNIRRLMGNAYIVKAGETVARPLVSPSTALKFMTFVKTTVPSVYDGIISVLAKVVGKDAEYIKTILSGKFKDDIFNINLDSAPSAANLQQIADTINTQLTEQESILVDTVYIVDINRLATNQYKQKVSLAEKPLSAGQKATLNSHVDTSAISSDSLTIMTSALDDATEAKGGGFVQFIQTGGADVFVDIASQLFYAQFIYPYVFMLQMIIKSVSHMSKDLTHVATDVRHVIDSSAKDVRKSIDAITGVPKKGGMRIISLKRRINF